MRPAIVMLHGFTNTGASWRPVLEAGVGERYRAMTPDIRGHGAASERRPVTLADVLDDVAALAPEPFTLVGYSMGGRIALHAAARMPERVERLVLIGASPGIADPTERAARRRADELLADEIERSDPATVAERWARTPVLADVPPDVAARQFADRIRSSPAGLAAALRGLGTGALPSLWDRLGELTMPVLVVAGERDTKFRSIGERMAGRIPRAELLVLPGAGHAAHLEVPDMLAAHLVVLATG